MKEIGILSEPHALFLFNPKQIFNVTVEIVAKFRKFFSLFSFYKVLIDSGDRRDRGTRVIFQGNFLEKNCNIRR